LGALALASLLFTAQPDSVHAEVTAIREGLHTRYSVPNGPRNLAVEAPGRVWFTAPDADIIGVIVVTSPPDNEIIRYRVDVFGLPPNSEPYDLVYAANTVWFTLRGASQIGRIDTISRSVELFTPPTPDSRPTGIDLGTDGTIWFAQATNRLGRFDPATASFTDHPFPAGLYEQTRVEKLAVEDERAIWFTLPDDVVVGDYDPVAEEFFAVPTGRGSPIGVTIDNQGRPWITASDANGSYVGRYAPGTLGQWGWFNTPTANSGPAGIVTFVDGATREVWFAESQSATAGRIQTFSGFSVRKRESIPLARTAPTTSRPWGITVDSNRHIWVADLGRNLVYELTPPYIYRIYLATVFGQNQGVPDSHLTTIDDFLVNVLD
jgi:virginiamycin B lyase